MNETSQNETSQNRTGQNEPLWHLLQLSDVLDFEMAAALAASVPVLAWEPRRVFWPRQTAPGAEPERSADAFRIRELPLLRGFARAPLSWVARTDSSILPRLLLQTPEPQRSPLICTTPYFAGVAERWPGPVVYWLTDLIAEYSSAQREVVHRLDRRMCQSSTLVCPNSLRLERYLVDTAGCDPRRIQVLPNATRAANVLPRAPEQTGPRPLAAMGLDRPIAGVIGNLAGNMDWLLIREMVRRTPWLTWLFVGPVGMHMPDRAARDARLDVMRLPNTSFAGRQPYGELAAFARTFDVAVLPYLRCEPTYSGSSTRFYEHLAACRPMLATRGLEELNRKTPMLELFDTADEGVAHLEALRAVHFDDGLAPLRWRSSREATWQFRARTLQDALKDALQLQGTGKEVDRAAMPCSPLLS